MKIVKKTDNLETFPYIAFIPDNLSPHPAIIFQLHGAGERGNGGADLDRVLIHGFSKVVNDDNLKDCVLILPQCPTDSFWVAKIESIKKFVDEMVLKHSADKNRLYLCGLSMGGFGTWYTAMAYPKLFAAIAPCCGGGMPWNAGAIAHLPIWAFHGLEDTVVAPSNTIDMVEKLKNCPNFNYSLYEGVGHNSWDKAFSEDLICWLLSQKK